MNTTTKQVRREAVEWAINTPNWRQRVIDSLINKQFTELCDFPSDDLRGMVCDLMRVGCTGIENMSGRRLITKIAAARYMNRLYHGDDKTYDENYPTFEEWISAGW